MTLKEKQAALVEEITLIPDAYERLGYIVERGKKATSLPEELHIDSFKIEGCMSQLWVVPEFKNGHCFFRSDSDSAIVKGIAELLCTFYSDASPEEILGNNAEFLGEVVAQLVAPRNHGIGNLLLDFQDADTWPVGNARSNDRVKTRKR